MREEVLILNSSFRKTLANHFTPIDIEQCSGEQEFQLLYGEEQCDDWHQDKRYFELFCVMLTPCYIEERELSSRVLTSECGGSIQANHILKIMCKCEIKTFKKAYEFVLTSVFENTKE